MNDIYFYILLALVAFLYASVGHGGASGYLALMAFFSFAPETMRSTALMLNIFVSSVSFYHFYRRDYFNWNLLWPFILASIPAAFLGAFFKLDPNIYKKILGVLLIFPVIKLAGLWPEKNEVLNKQNLWLSLLIGFLIGLFSGMIGIGGGIILSPVILLLGWADMKQTAAASALFILLNSIAGLAGLFKAGFQLPENAALLVFIAFTGGAAGAYWGAGIIKAPHLRKVLAFVLLLASVKLILT